MDARETTLEAVAFRVDGRSYALPLDQVVEVVRMVAIIPVPDAPAWVAGVVNLRGALIPMIDLRPRFGAAPTEIDPDHVFLVAQAAGRTAGVMADCVEDVVEVGGASEVVTLDLERLLGGADVGVWGRGVDMGGWHRAEGRDDVAAGGATP